MEEKLEIFIFPTDFLWGSATAPQQNEGGNWNSDWWELEYKENSPLKDKSGDATGFYHTYKEDIAMLKELGLNALRFGLAWERIEPEEGQFSLQEMKHYVEIVDYCRENGIEPVVTINHFSLPRWIGHHGGFFWDQIVEKYCRFVEYVIPFLKGKVNYILSLNEPDLETNFGFRWGFFPGGIWIREQGIDPNEAADRVRDNLIAAHNKAREIVKRLAPEMQYGWSLSTNVIEARPGFEEITEIFRSRWQDPFYAACKGDDFVAIQPYTKWVISQDKNAPDDGILWVNLTDYPEKTRTLETGLAFYPQVVYEMSRYVHEKTGLPILITENGVGTSNDSTRQEYILQAIPFLARAIKKGVPILGYFHWTFIDNWEWADGYSNHFGLIANDPKTQQRTIRESALLLGNIAKDNKIIFTLTEED